MATSTTFGKSDRKLSQPGKARIWLLQYGPCWCGSVPSDSSAFDYFRFRRTITELGTLKENLLIMSARVIDGASGVFRQVFDDVPEPKLVISTAACPNTQAFWDALPNGWTPVEEILPVDIEVDECISGEPEALMVAVLSHLFSRKTNHDIEEKEAALGG